MVFKKYIKFLLMAAILCSCGRAVPELFPDDINKRPVTVYVVSHGWHVGLAVPVDSVFKNQLGGDLHVDDYAWAEFGWGDRDFYMTPKPGFWISLKGAVWPTLSAVHASAFDREVTDRFRGQKMVRVQLTEQGYDAALEFIRETMQMESGKPIELGDGIYGDARFYASRRRYYLARNSNVWTARLLREAGAPINTWIALTSGNVIRQARGFGEFIEE